MTDIEQIKQKCINRWPEIINRLGGIPADVLDGRQHPCPSGKCASQTDAFRVFRDFDSTGGMVCNQCGKFGDGIAALQWLMGTDFKSTIKSVAELIGFDLKSKTKKWRPPLEQIIPLKTQRDQFAFDFCRAKRGLTKEQLNRTRWTPAKWPRTAPAEFQFDVLAFVSVRLPEWENHSVILYRRDGKPFPENQKFKLPQRKAHILPGSQRGNRDGIIVVGNRDEFESAHRCWKCEGVTDAICLAGYAPKGDIVVANICGAGSFDEKWKATFQQFRSIAIVGDNDPSLVGGNGAYKFAGMIQ